MSDEFGCTTAIFFENKEKMIPLMNKIFTEKKDNENSRFLNFDEIFKEGIFKNELGQNGFNMKDHGFTEVEEVSFCVYDDFTSIIIFNDGNGFELLEKFASTNCLELYASNYNGFSGNSWFFHFNPNGKNVSNTLICTTIPFKDAEKFFDFSKITGKNIDVILEKLSNEKNIPLLSGSNIEFLEKMEKKTSDFHNNNIDLFKKNIVGIDDEW